MPDNRSLRIMAAIAGSFTMLVVVVLGLLIAGILSFPLALLMCVALVGLYVGFGILALAARLINNLK